MATEFKRFTISVPPSMEGELDHVKKELYYNVTQNGMIRDLIDRGLKTIEMQKQAELIGTTERHENSLIGKTNQSAM